MLDVDAQKISTSRYLGGSVLFFPLTRWLDSFYNLDLQWSSLWSEKSSRRRGWVHFCERKWNVCTISYVDCTHNWEQRHKRHQTLRRIVLTLFFYFYLHKYFLPRLERRQRHLINILLLLLAQEKNFQRGKSQPTQMIGSNWRTITGDLHLQSNM